MNTRSGVLAAVVAGLLALAGCSGGRARPTSAVPSPDVGQPVVLDSRVPGWQTSAWLAGDSFCVRGARLGGDPAGNSVFCEPAPAALKNPGPALLPAKPLPYLAPADPRAERILLVGTVRGQVATVSTTMLGEDVTAEVHPLPVTGGRHVGAYAVWLPRGHGDQEGMSLDDIVRVIGRDAAGNEVTRLG